MSIRGSAAQQFSLCGRAPLSRRRAHLRFRDGRGHDGACPSDPTGNAPKMRTAVGGLGGSNVALAFSGTTIRFVGGGVTYFFLQLTILGKALEGASRRGASSPLRCRFRKASA